MNESKALPRALLDYIEASEHLLELADRYGENSKVVQMMSKPLYEKWMVLRTLSRRKRSNAGISVFWIMDENRPEED